MHSRPTPGTGNKNNSVNNDISEENKTSVVALPLEERTTNENLGADEGNEIQESTSSYLHSSTDIASWPKITEKFIEEILINKPQN
ncbi:hypothetical protein FQR65_LT15709 [Abscondita terminalis]|nr:hypothetical protein FQR65_LT15709 [Abscondita terminalis]